MAISDDDANADGGVQQHWFLVQQRPGVERFSSDFGDPILRENALVCGHFVD